MATERLSMRRVKEILRLREQGRTVREVARSLGVSVGSVSKTTSRAKAVGLSWAVAQALKESEIEQRLRGRRAALSSSDENPRTPHGSRPRPPGRFALRHEASSCRR